MPAKTTEPPAKRLVDLVTHALEITADIEAKEEALSDSKKSLERIQRTDLPELLKELGMSDASLKDLGVKVALSQGVEASIPEAVRSDAFAWLAENGHGAIVRAEVSVVFGAAELERAQACADVLREGEYTPEVGMSVPAPTLKAWARERLAAGDVIPPELFSVRPYDFAKFTTIKKKS